MERRLAAILAADVKGYSHLTELNEEASTATLRMYRAVVEESISAHKGHVFSSAGDSVVAEFPSIVEAIRCAVEIQNEIAERNTSVPKSEQMQFRIGVHKEGRAAGEAIRNFGLGSDEAAGLGKGFPSAAFAESPLLHRAFFRVRRQARQNRLLWESPHRNSVKSRRLSSSSE